MKASESPYREIATITTGLPLLDNLTGIGGIPFRRITEIYGPYSVGKTTLGLQIVAQAQKQGISCLWADVEWAWDEAYASRLGVNLDTVELVQESISEASLDVILNFAAKETHSLIVLDSVGALHPREEAEKDSSGRMIGGQAKMVSTFCRRIVPHLAINNNALVVLNHSFIDLMHGNIKTSGGQKLEYHKSLSISLRKLGQKVIRGGEQAGELIEAEIKKNKLAPTLKKTCELAIIYGEGFDAGYKKRKKISTD